MLRISLILVVGLALGACVKPATTSVAPRSSNDLYNMCGDVKNGCSSPDTREQAPLVDTNLSSQPRGTFVATLG